MAESSAAVVAELTVPVRGDLTPLHRDLAAAKRELEAFNNSLGGGPSSGGSSAMNKLNRDMKAANDNVVRMSKDMNIANDNVKKMQLAFTSMGGTATASFGQLESGADDAANRIAFLEGVIEGMVAELQRMSAAIAGTDPALANNTNETERNTQAKDRNAKASRYAANQQRILAYQLVDVTQMLAMGQAPLMTLIQQGPQIAQIYGPSEGGLGKAFSESAKMVGSLIAKFPLLSAGALAAGMAIFEIRSQLKDAGHDAITFGDVVLGLFKTIGEYIGDALSPIQPYVSAIWDWLVSSTKAVLNLIIKSFQIAANDIMYVFKNFPNVMASAIASAADMVVTAIEAMVNYSIQGFNKLIQTLNTVTAALPSGIAESLNIGEIGEISLGRVNRGSIDQDLSGAQAERLRRQEEILNSDPIGEFAEAWRENSVEAMRERLAKKAKKGRKEKEDPYAKIIRDAKQFIAAQELEAQALGMTEEAAARLRYEQELLNKAADANIKLTPKQTQELKNLAAQMAAAEETTRKLKEAYEFGKEATRGFFSDMKSGLMEGQSVWESFGNAVANVLDKIADKALEMAADGIWDMIWNGGSSGGSGGGVGGLLGFIFNGFKGFANGTNYAPGGTAWVGERGPELMKLPGGSQIVPNNRISALNTPTSMSGASRMQIDVGVYVKDDGTLGAIARQAGKEGGQEAFDVNIQVYDREQLPNSIERVRQNPNMR